MGYKGTSAYAQKCKERFLELASSIGKETFISYYNNNGTKATIEHFGITRTQYVNLMEYFEVPRLSLVENVRFARERNPLPNPTWLSSEECKKKRAETNLRKYGSVSPLGNKKVREKVHQSVLERYGVDNVFQDEEVKKKIRESSNTRYGGIGFASEELMSKYKGIMLDKYGVEYACFLPQFVTKNNGCNSAPNRQFAQLLETNGLQYEAECVVGNYRYDFKVGNVLIEINPTYTHNSTAPYHGFKGILPPDYHFKKSQVAVDNGFQCICVWEWDDPKKIIDLLKDRQTTYARKCQVKTVKNKVAEEYLNAHHLQGYANSPINIGLFYGDDMVAIMVFDKPKHDKDYQYELVRYCSTFNVVGGAEKLFKYFTRKYNPTSIISYCDRSKFVGKVYGQLGFTAKPYAPSKYWHRPKTKDPIADDVLRQRGLDNLSDESSCKNNNYEELMIERGFLEVYDCGQQPFVWENR